MAAGIRNFELADYLSCFCLHYVQGLVMWREKQQHRYSWKILELNAVS